MPVIAASDYNTLVLLLLTLALLTAGLVVLAYRLPARRGLYAAQLAALGLCLALWVPLAREADNRLPGELQVGRELLQATLALGVWLNAVRWVRRVRLLAGQWVLLALAVAAVQSLLLLGPAHVLAHYSRVYPALRLWQVAYVALGLAEVLAAWGLVSWQLRGQLPGAAWRPWWLLALLTAAIGTATLLVGVWFTFWQNQLTLTPLLLLRIGAQNMAIGWVWSLLALLVLRPARHAADAPPAAKAQ